MTLMSQAETGPTLSVNICSRFQLLVPKSHPSCPVSGHDGMLGLSSPWVAPRVSLSLLCTNHAAPGSVPSFLSHNITSVITAIEKIINPTHAHTHAHS